MIKIIVVDDHPVVRRGLKQIINEECDMEVAGEAENAQEAFGVIRNRRCDLILLDITMPGTSGLDVLKQLKYEYPELPVLVLSVHSEDQYAIRAIRAGASGYLTKDSVPETLINAVRKVISGGKYVSPLLAEKLALEVKKSEMTPHETLSDREYQIMCLIASGKTNREIAEGLCLSVKTVSTYRTRLLQKMHLKTDAELTTYALRNKLIE